MTTATINVLEQIKKGNSYILTKDVENEIYEIILKLNNLGIISKAGNSYKVNFQKMAYLSKLIELDNFENFLYWLEKEDTNKENLRINNVIFNKGDKNVISVNSEKQENKFEKSLFWIAVIGIIITILTFLFGDNILKSLNFPISKNPSNIEKKNITSVSKQVITSDTIGKGLTPYLKSEAILDKGLFFSHNHTELIFGGTNINQVKLNARKDTGEKITLHKNDSEDIILDIYEKPYLEFEYKNSFYKLEIYIDDRITFYYDLIKISAPTLILIKATDIN